MQQESDHKLTDETCVSVVIPYSPEHTPSEMLQEAKQSVESQTVATDIIVIKDTEQHGPAWARNQGLRQASTRFVAFLDADDLWKSKKLTVQFRSMQESNSGICVEGEYDNTNKFMQDLFIMKTSSLTSSILIDTNQVDVQFDQNLDRREDHLFILEAMAKSGGCFRPNLVKIRKHEGGLSSQNTPELRIEQNKHFVELVAKKVSERLVEKHEDELFRRLYHGIGRGEHQEGRYRPAIYYFYLSLSRGLSIKTAGAMLLSAGKWLKPR